MLENILKTVQESDFEADMIITDAEKQAAELLDDARKEANALKDDMAQKIKLRNQTTAERMQTEINQQMIVGAAAVSEDVAQLKMSAGEKQKEAVNAVIALLI